MIALGPHRTRPAGKDAVIRRRLRLGKAHSIRMIGPALPSLRPEPAYDRTLRRACRCRRRRSPGPGSRDRWPAGPGRLRIDRQRITDAREVGRRLRSAWRSRTLAGCSDSFPGGGLSNAPSSTAARQADFRGHARGAGHPTSAEREPSLGAGRRAMFAQDAGSVAIERPHRLQGRRRSSGPRARPGPAANRVPVDDRMVEPVAPAACRPAHHPARDSRPGRSKNQRQLAALAGVPRTRAQTAAFALHAPQSAGTTVLDLLSSPAAAGRWRGHALSPMAKMSPRHVGGDLSEQRVS